MKGLVKKFLKPEEEKETANTNTRTTTTTTTTILTVVLMCHHDLKSMPTKKVHDFIVIDAQNLNCRSFIKKREVLTLAILLFHW